MKKAKTVSFHTLGCRLNMSETGSIAQGFADRGYEIKPYGSAVDVTFLNTCTVTDGADSTCRNQIRKAQKASPEGQVVVAGCYAQMEAEKVKAMQGVDLILGTHEKHKVFEYLASEQENNVHIDKTNEFWGAATTEADSHTRAFLKIQDGCNYICSFCIIPFARGRSRTITIQNAVAEAKNLVSRGFKEIVLTGVNIGEYESTSGERLVDLVQGILEVEGLKRLRLSSVEPNTISEELLKVLKASEKYQDHFHIPLQSGSDRVLRSMRRKYDVQFYRGVIKMVKEYFPEASIGADIIAGYPGETEVEFQETFNLVKELPLTHFHVFPYSKRKNTTAAKEEAHIQGDVKKARVKKLIALGNEKLEDFTKKQERRSVEVLFEIEKDGYFHGHTPNYVKVKVPATGQDLRNKIIPVLLSNSEGKYIAGELKS